jgi:hypothetical protein
VLGGQVAAAYTPTIEFDCVEWENDSRHSRQDDSTLDIFYSS